ncbi:MAG TPA: hypothetical protein VN455_10675 [Methanotrichaceae archaeon]|nr:hypothetical protein [Methanotrichaceae archaeon]
MIANSTATRKAKARRLQNLVVEKIRATLGLSEIEVQSRGMGQSGCDIILSEAARAKLPFAIEAKSSDKIEIWKALEQCKVNAKKEGLKPMLVFKRERSEVWAVLMLDDLLELMKA